MYLNFLKDVNSGEEIAIDNNDNIKEVSYLRKLIEEEYADRDNDEGGNYQLYAKADNFLVIDAEEEDWNYIPVYSETAKALGIEAGRYKTREISKFAKDAGYDGVKFENLQDNGEFLEDFYTSDIYIIFDPANVKSADPITYDDNGDVIPLSQRFNSSNNDIRYSEKTDSGMFVDEDGVENYPINESIRNLSYDERRTALKNILKKELKDTKVRFVKGDKTYLASITKSSIDKNIYGSNSSKNGYDAKIGIGINGNFIDLPQNAEYLFSKPEEGNKRNKFHKDAKVWDYYFKTIKYGEDYFDILIDVMWDGKDNYLYDIEIKGSGIASDKLMSDARTTPNKKVPSMLDKVKGLFSEKLDLDDPFLLFNAQEDIAQGDEILKSDLHALANAVKASNIKKNELLTYSQKRK